MEAQGYNPYEQQLLSVYESCLEIGKSGLNEKGLKLLCDKLQLEERSVELIASLLEQSSDDHTISFNEFRNGLLSLLGNAQDIPDHSNNIQIIDESSSIMETNKYDERGSLTFERHRLKQLYHNNSNDDVNVMIKNSPVMNILDESVISKRMLKEIFQKVDVNCDGQITFNEFLSLFQNERNIDINPLEDGTWNDRCVNNTNTNKNQHLIMLGPDHTSFIERHVVVNLWQMAGVIDASTLLRDLGFTNVNINLIELMAILTDELKSLEHELRDETVTITHVNLLRGALVLYQEEVRSMNTLNDQLTREKDKLKADVAEANESANIIAQENDEAHVKLEKKRQEELKQLELKHAELIKELSMQNNCERETYISRVKLLNEQLQGVQHEEQLNRDKLADALNENHTLEVDNQHLAEQISKLKMSNNQLMRQMQILAAEHDEVERNVEKENEQVISLVDRIKKLQTELSLLRDQNDELTSEVESLRARTNHYKTKSFENNTNFSDSEESNCVTDYEPLGKQVPELKDAIIDDKVTNLSNTVALIIRDLKNITLDRKTPNCSSDCVLKRNLSDIIFTLESQILTKINGKVDAIKNNEEECEERTSESLRDFVLSKNEKSRITTTLSNNTDEIIDNLDINSKCKTLSLRDYPPRRGENGQSEQLISDDDKSISLNIENSIDAINNIETKTIEDDRNKLKALLQEQEIKYNNEKKQLQEQCAKLESNLESLRTEYYQCEDYWANKLEEERQLIEQEQKISDEKLGELIAKIAEYEEQFSMSDKSRNDGRLSPIEEKFNLEQQYIDLEDEYEQLKREMQDTINEKENQLTILQDKLNDSEVEKVDSGIQVSDLDDNKIIKKALCQSNTMPLHYVLPHELSNVINPSGQSIATNINHGMNQKQFGSGKLNKIVEHSISDNEVLLMPPTINSKLGNSGCSYSCQQLDTYCNMDEITKMHRVELQRISQKRAHNNVSVEYKSLMEQKECLIKEIMELQNFYSNRLYSDIDGQVTKIDMNFIKNLMAKLQTQDQKRKNLQISLKHQKQHTEKILEHTWKQHCNEIANLQLLLKDTENSLQHQIAMNSMFMEKLSKSDLLLKDLYVENAYLKENVERLGERCHMLAHLSSGSTSV